MQSDPLVVVAACEGVQSLNSANALTFAENHQNQMDEIAAAERTPRPQDFPSIPGRHGVNRLRKKKSER
jgi:hypothetical protein